MLAEPLTVTNVTGKSSQFPVLSSQENQTSYVVADHNVLAPEVRQCFLEALWAALIVI